MSGLDQCLANSPTPKDVKELKNQFHAFKGEVTGTRGNIMSEIQKLSVAAHINARPLSGLLGSLSMHTQHLFHQLVSYPSVSALGDMDFTVNEKLHDCQISTLRWTLLSCRFDQPVVLDVRGDRLDRVHVQAHQEVLKVTAINPLQLINLYGFQRGIAQVREWQLSCNAYFGLKWASVPSASNRRTR